MSTHEVYHISRVLKNANMPIEIGYLFGSQITGDTTSSSDIDIAVLFNKKTTLMQRFNMRLKLMTMLQKTLKKPIDLVVLNDTRSIFFKFVIISEGERCYVKNEDTMADFELTTINDYIDFKPFLDAYNDRYVQKYSQ